VRIFYDEGYHVDMPIYRIRESDGEYELACGDEWVVSRAADVETWFYNTNSLKSPDENNGRQFRRDVRLLKKFARSREDWKDQMASGFTITKLAEECYVADKDREDKALRDTMRSIHDRLLNDLEVQHPVTPGAMLTAGPNDKSTQFLRNKLDQALKDLEVLDKSDCTRKDALAAWDKVYDTDFFSARYKNETEKASSTANAEILSNLITTHKDPQAVDKRGGGRFA
jgi:hypothetical protein